MLTRLTTRVLQFPDEATITAQLQSHHDIKDNPWIQKKVVSKVAQTFANQALFSKDQLPVEMYVAGSLFGALGNLNRPGPSSNESLFLTARALIGCSTKIPGGLRFPDEATINAHLKNHPDIKHNPLIQPRMIERVAQVFSNKALGSPDRFPIEMKIVSKVFIEVEQPYIFPKLSRSILLTAQALIESATEIHPLNPNTTTMATATAIALLASAGWVVRKHYLKR
jgi:hypothetical protein